MSFYDNHAEEYFATTINLDLNDRRERFLSNFHALPHNLLDIGCGSCRDTIAFIDKGIEVLPLDNSIELAKVAKREVGIDVLVEDIRNWNYPISFDAIWACASLLHLTEDEITKVLISLKNSLTPNGLFYISLKSGENSETTSDGRFFEYYSKEKFERILNKTGYEVKDFWTNDDCYRHNLTWVNFVVKTKEVH